jgi:hypothetical protein
VHEKRDEEATGNDVMMEEDIENGRLFFRLICSLRIYLQIIKVFTRLTELANMCLTYTFSSLLTELVAELAGEL